MRCAHVSVCLPFLQPEITYQNVLLAAPQKGEKGEEKMVPKVWGKDLTSLERHHKLFAVCSTLKDRGSSQVDGGCKEGRCWRKSRRTG